MTEVTSVTRRFLTVGGVATVAAGAASRLWAADTPRPPLRSFAKGALSHLRVAKAPKVLAEVPLFDDEGNPVRLSDLHGRIVVLNIWATWVAPSRFEIPSLAKLQQHYAGKPILFLPLSVDDDDHVDSAYAYVAQHEPLKTWFTDLSSTLDWDVQGLPATLILDKQGRKIAQLDSETDWESPEAMAFLDRLLAEP